MPPFPFPRATAHENWNGQVDLVGLLPRLQDSLGVCFGISLTWIAKAAPFWDVAKMRTHIKDKDAIRVQTYLTVTMEEAGATNTEWTLSAELEAMTNAVESEFSPVRCTDRRWYPEGIASHIILDILTDATPKDYLLGYRFTGGHEGTGGHAIAVCCTGAHPMILDPNHGVGRYGTRSALCSDLHDLLRCYVMPTGHLTCSFLLECELHDPFAAFGALNAGSAAAVSSLAVRGSLGIGARGSTSGTGPGAAADDDDFGPFQRASP